MRNRRNARALFIGAALLLVGAAGCNKDKGKAQVNDEPGVTTTTAAGVAIPATEPASPVDLEGRARKERGTDPNANGGLSDPNANGGANSSSNANGGSSANGPPALPGQITPPNGDSFESSGGSSGLGPAPVREVPGQRFFDLKPTTKRDGG